MSKDDGMDFLSRLDSAAEQFADLAATGDLTAPVPSCPSWTLNDLVAHVGEVHQWARHAVVVGNPDAKPIPAPSTQPALVEWYREAAGELSSTLRQTDPQAPVWSFGPKPRTASFWFRRQAHETTLHLWDAGLSQGLDRPIDPTLAWDGIDEVATVFLPRQIRLGRTSPLEHSLALVGTGPEPLPRLVLAGDGSAPVAADAPADATVTGPADVLLLLIWGRTSLDDPRLVVTGDEAAAHVVLSHALAP